eukprot:scaffold11025_cov41-Phaeocystis_antarctica.AAC.3
MSTAPAPQRRRLLASRPMRSGSGGRDGGLGLELDVDGLDSASVADGGVDVLVVHRVGAAVVGGRLDELRVVLELARGEEHASAVGEVEEEEEE